SDAYFFILLSPDASKAAYCNTSQCGVAGKDGSNVKLPAHFGPTGWLDGTTLIGLTNGSEEHGGVLGGPSGEMATVSLGDVAKVNDLGFRGSFAGIVQAS